MQMMSWIFSFKVAIIGGRSQGMEVWNPSDDSVQKIFTEVPPEEGDSSSLDFAQLLAINGGRELLLYGGNQVPLDPKGKVPLIIYRIHFLALGFCNFIIS